MNQTQAFIDSEGDAWFERNERKLGLADPVTPVVERLDPRPKTVLEIGCCNGWRLKKLRETLGCEIAGIDPSKQAVMLANEPAIQRGWASALHYLDGEFNLVIYGFCLYVIEPEDWFTVVSEGDRVLADGGHIIIHDFADHGNPHAVPYEHAEGLLSYHFNFASMWLAHPWYRLVDWKQPAKGELVATLQKNTQRIPVWP
jgi:ubiquinone/menaquinone biosynthesis C-methylase UbiE